MKPGPFRSVALIGPRAAGKSALLRPLAARLSAAAVDTDLELARAVGMGASAYLAAAGERAFRRAEAAAVLAALRRPAPTVVALGGGAVLQPAVAAALEADDLLVVLLLADPERLRARQAAAPRPPLTGLPLAAEVRALLQQRLWRYRRLCDLELDTGRLSPAACVEAIAAVAGR